MRMQLIEAGVDVNRIPATPSGDTALHECAINGCDGIAKLLINAGASPFLANKQGMTALDHAIAKGQAPMMRRFEERAMHAGWVFVKMHRYRGLSHAWKARWATVFRTNLGASGGVGATRTELCLYKNLYAFKPCSRFVVDGARAEIRHHNAEGTPLGLLCCIVSLPANQRCPSGIVASGDPRVGWSFEARPVCRSDAAQELQEAAWRSLTSFANAINSIGLSSSPRRRTYDSSEGYAVHRRAVSYSYDAAAMGGLRTSWPRPLASMHVRATSLPMGIPESPVPQEDGRGVDAVEGELPQGRDFSEEDAEASVHSVRIGSVMEDSFPTAPPWSSMEADTDDSALVTDAEALSEGLAASVSPEEPADRPEPVSAAPPGSAGGGDADRQDDTLEEGSHPAVVIGPFLPEAEAAGAQLGPTEGPHRVEGAGGGDGEAPAEEAPSGGSGLGSTLPQVPSHAVRNAAARGPYRVAEDDLPAQIQLTGLARLFGAGSASQHSPAQHGTGDDGTCVICLERPRTAGFVHGESVHKCCCKDCATKFKNDKEPYCPLCRRRIDHVLFAFFE